MRRTKVSFPLWNIDWVRMRFALTGNVANTLLESSDDFWWWIRWNLSLLAMHGGGKYIFHFTEGPGIEQMY